jgi:hypothetical protein
VCRDQGAYKVDPGVFSSYKRRSVFSQTQSMTAFSNDSGTRSSPPMIGRLSLFRGMPSTAAAWTPVSGCVRSSWGATCEYFYF